MIYIYYIKSRDIDINEKIIKFEIQNLINIGILFMKERINAAGGIVIHPQTGKLLITTKIKDQSKYSKYSKYTKEELINVLGAYLPKWKLGNNEDFLIAAKREIEEECWIRNSNLKLIGDLSSFEKTKGKTTKYIKMYIFTLFNEQEEYVPSHNKHISEFLDLEDIWKLLVSKEEKEFFQEHKNLLKLFKRMILTKNNFAKSEENHKQEVYIS